MIFYVFVDLLDSCLLLEGNREVILGSVVHVQNAEDRIK